MLPTLWCKQRCRCHSVSSVSFNAGLDSAVGVILWRQCHAASAVLLSVPALVCAGVTHRWREQRCRCHSAWVSFNIGINLQQCRCHAVPSAPMCAAPARACRRDAEPVPTRPCHSTHHFGRTFAIKKKKDAATPDMPTRTIAFLCTRHAFHLELCTDQFARSFCQANLNCQSASNGPSVELWRTIYD
jgi:hypothetical protein